MCLSEHSPHLLQVRPDLTKIAIQKHLRIIAPGWPSTQRRVKKNSKYKILMNDTANQIEMSLKVHQWGD